MTTSLFALTSEATLLAARIDDTAERLFSDDPADVAAATEALEQLITAEASNRQALTAKADAWCWVIDNLRSQADARREHAKRLAEMADEAEHRAQALQDQLVAALSHVDPDATKWELLEHKITSRRSSAVEIDPDLLPQDLPEQFQRVKTTVSADKTALAAALKAGATVPGCTLTSRRSWSIK
jgi:chromosome segregation ATPase